MQTKVFSLGVDSSTFHWYTQAELCAAGKHLSWGQALIPTSTMLRIALTS